MDAMDMIKGIALGDSYTNWRKAEAKYDENLKRAYKRGDRVRWRLGGRHWIYGRVVRVMPGGAHSRIMVRSDSTGKEYPVCATRIMRGHGIIK